MDDAVVRLDIGLYHHRHAYQLLLGVRRGAICTGDGILRRPDSIALWCDNR